MAVSEEKILFYNSDQLTCPFAQRVWICLNAKNVAFEMVTIDLYNVPAEYHELYEKVRHTAASSSNTRYTILYICVVYFVF